MNYEERYISFIGKDWWKEDLIQIMTNLIGAPIDPRIPYYGDMGELLEKIE
jgi:hypothetical protein